MAHTPTPFRIRRPIIGAPIIEGGGHEIAKVLYWSGSENVSEVEANAELLVQAANAYDDLKAKAALLDEAVEVLEAMVEDYETASPNPVDSWLKAAQVLAKAKARMSGGEKP